jgi:hypothetical protein
VSTTAFKNSNFARQRQAYGTRPLLRRDAAKRGPVAGWPELDFSFFNQEPLSLRQRAIVERVGRRLPADTDARDRLMVLVAWMRPDDASDTKVREVADEVTGWLLEANGRRS